MQQKQSFDALNKLPEMRFGDFCGQHRIRVNPALEIDPQARLDKGLEALFQAQEKVGFFQVLAHALPVRERVWFACLAAQRLLPPEVKSSPCLTAARAWVYKPNIKTRENVAKAIAEAQPDDPTVLAADAAFHGIVGGLDDEVKSPPAACSAMVFAAVIQALFDGENEEALQQNWHDLVACGVNIAQGGNGQLEGADA